MSEMKVARIQSRLEQDRVALQHALSNVESVKALVSVGEYDLAGQLLFSTKHSVREQLSRSW